jgi:hypothetical protein
MYQEIAAWRNAEEGINKILKKHVLDEEAEEKLVNQTSRLKIPALTSYAGSEVGTFLPIANAIAPIATSLTGAMQVGKEKIKKEVPRWRVPTG